MNREGALKVVLVVVGLIFLFAVYPLMMYLWPSGWRWQPNPPEYEQMILGVYGTLGIFLLLASRNPSEHRSLIAFTAWSSLVHAAIMAVQAFRNASERGHLLGDVWVGIVKVRSRILRCWVLDFSGGLGRGFCAAGDGRDRQNVGLPRSEPSRRTTKVRLPSQETVTYFTAGILGNVGN